jgi:FkbM family methyltransferase
MGSVDRADATARTIQDGRQMGSFADSDEAFEQDLAGNPHRAGEVAFLRSIATRGMTVIEAGANRGLTTVTLAGAVGEAGHVYVFEPVPEYYSRLVERVSASRVGNVSTYRLALSNQAGRMAFYKRSGGGSGITPAQGGDLLSVEATTVSEFLMVEGIEELDLVNLDCEGSELLVLQGARTALQSRTPLVFCEVHRGYLAELGQSPADVAGYLQDLGYQVEPVQVEKLESDATIETCSHVYAHMSEAGV